MRAMPNVRETGGTLEGHLGQITPVSHSGPAQLDERCMLPKDRATVTVLPKCPSENKLSPVNHL
jgi:hypothetical protein